MMNKKSAAEVIIGLVLCFSYIWGIFPHRSFVLSAIFFALFLFLLIYSRKKHKESWKDIGITGHNFVASGKPLLALTLLAAVALSLLWHLFFPITPENFEYDRLGVNVLRYPLWALFQQYIV